MNERIKELAHRCGFTEYRGDDGCDDESLTKFAELIVRECVKIAYQNDIAKFTKDGYRIGMDIQKYFGVEE